MSKLLKDLLTYKGILSVNGSDDKSILALEIDSRAVREGSMFFAVKGTVIDAHTFIPDVVSKGCSVIVCSDLPKETSEAVTYIVVDDVQQSVGYFASEFYGHPSTKFKLVGITGTNGKTTTSTMLFNLFTSLGYQCGLVSTVDYRIGEKVYTSSHTTPNPIRLNELMAEMADANCDYCFMEVSSHSVVQGRINGLDFDGGVFTNITHDHLDYHGTFDQYIKAKKLFFDHLPLDAFALVNKDDKNGLVMVQNTKATKYTYALRTSADFQCKVLESDFAGLLLKIDQDEVWFNLVGQFNAYNLLAVYSVAFILEVDRQEILKHLSKQAGVSGRFEVYRSSNGIIGIIDYAHTPDALENVLSTINHIRTSNEQLITVVGCGGNRDKEKRPVMGKVAASMSDKVILTSDNPRQEDPKTIINEMMAGIEATHYKKAMSITDREEALRAAVMMSKPKDIILVAGKGHETYQEINGVKYPFDDRVILNQIFRTL